jgi:hypothetical protein
MRVAVSGTHCCGKSTLIDEFLLAHPEFTHEPEPYAVLEEEYGEVFAAEPSQDDFFRQLEFNVDRLRLYKPGERVIFERSPVDFLAYMLALNDLRRGEKTTRLIEMSLDLLTDAISFLDLIVFLTLDDEDGIVISDSEDAQLRGAVNSRLMDILNDDQFDLFSSHRPLVVQAMGSTAQRLRTLENVLGAQPAEGKAE